MWHLGQELDQATRGPTFISTPHEPVKEDKVSRPNGPHAVTPRVSSFSKQSWDTRLGKSFPKDWAEKDKMPCPKGPHAATTWASSFNKQPMDQRI